LKNLKIALTFTLATLVTAGPASAAMLSTCANDASLSMHFYAAAAAFAAEGLWGAAASMTEEGNYYAGLATACAL
jgi:hypothetical protein